MKARSLSSLDSEYESICQDVVCTPVSAVMGFGPKVLFEHAMIRAVWPGRTTNTNEVRGKVNACMTRTQRTVES